MKILVVGASGFIGRALVDRLVLQGHDVEAWDRRGGESTHSVRRIAVDLLSNDALPVPQARTWDAAFQLAAHALPGMPWTRGLVMENLSMTARVLEHLVQHAPGCLAIVASSGQVYAPSTTPVAETAPLGPLRLYGLSKQLCEAWAYSMRDRLQVQIIRAFNQIGPGMARGLLIPDVLDKLSRNEPSLRMSGRDDQKDFLDWRDAMDAYVALLDRPGASGSTYNLCSGEATRVSSLIGQMLTEKRMTREVHFADVRVETLLGDPAKLMQATGWAPRRSLQDTVHAICAAASQS